MFPNGKSSKGSVDSITAPITAMAQQLRTLQQTKAAEAAGLRARAAELQQQAVEADNEADRASRTAEQLEGLVL